MIARVFTLLFALAGAGTLSQAPEFAQQYRQALGGAVAELQVIAEDFDAASERAGLSRDQALAQYRDTGNTFLGERGEQISGTLERYDRLKDQAEAIEGAGPFERIWLVLREPDLRVVEGARERFEPAVPLTIAGGIMALLGAFIGWLVARGGATTAKATGKMLRGRNAGRRAKV